MRAAFLVPGSRGDVQPYVALAQALRWLGHSSILVTTADHEALVRGFDLELETLPMNVAEELARAEALGAVEGGGVVASFRAFAEIARRGARALAEQGLAASRDADVIVTGFSAALLGDAIARRLRRPLLQAYNVPITASRFTPGALFPRLDVGGASRRVGHALTRTALWTTARSAASEAARDVLGVRLPLLPPAGPGLVPGPLAVGVSEAFMPRPSDWPRDILTTGFWFVEERREEVPPALARFVEEGPPPVCVGFGSMSTSRPEEVSALVVEAAHAAGTRLVLLSGWAGLDARGLDARGLDARGPDATRLSDEVLTVRSAPHGWLYERCRAVVHHGGAGTTAAAVRAGVPAVVVPFHGDQPFWAERVHALGLGPAPIPRTKLSAARLATALREATTSEALRERAAAVGRVVRSEEGALDAARWIARHAG